MISQKISQAQKLSIAPRQLQALKLLEKSIPDLRQEILAEMSSNPAIEDLDHTIEETFSDVEHETKDASSLPDYPEDDYVPGIAEDDAFSERRQALFDKQVKEETLQEHLLKQLPLSDIPPEQWPIVESLVSDLNDDGFYKGSIADMQMVYGLSAAEITEILRKMTELDPLGCGATTARECLLAQLSDVKASDHKDIACRIINDCLPDIVSSPQKDVADKLGVSPEDFKAAMTIIKSLNPHPGRAFASARDRVEYINPEIHAVKRDGYWYAQTDARSLPEIKISQHYRNMLSNPDTDKELKNYIAAKIESAEMFRRAVEERQKTILTVAQTIFDRQQEFFEEGFAALKPLTQIEVASIVGVDNSTISRAVKDKYASTPQGTIELRRFFSSGVKTSVGTDVSQSVISARLKELIENEDSSSPLSDQKLSEILKEEGFLVARRTVAKYREQLSIPRASER
jgi:RNA polymerase sigma-54 factor